MAYWLLMGTPWPRYVTQPDPANAFLGAAALGELFDHLSARPRYLRTWARRWLTWCERHIQSFALVWGAYAPPPPPPALAPPAGGPPLLAVALPDGEAP
jgi:hypothetical protein